MTSYNIEPKQLDFKFHIPMSAQQYIPVVGSDALVAVPFKESLFCKAYVVATPETVVKAPNVLNVCLQFSRPVKDPFLPAIYKVATEKQDTFVGLHIVPKPTTIIQGKEAYHLDNDEPRQWTDAVEMTGSAVHGLWKGDPQHLHRPILQVFALAPVALMFAVGMQFYRFWHVRLYNFVGGPYKRVIDIKAES